MSTVRRRRTAAAALAAAAALSLSACGTGFNAQTNHVYQAGIGANHRSGEVDVLNTLLVANDDGSATLSAGVVNKTDSEQRLESVSATTLADEQLEVESGKTAQPLPADTLSTLGGASDAGGFLISEGATPGSYVKLTLTFSGAGPITIQAPVVARTADYADVAEGNINDTTPADEDSAS